MRSECRVSHDTAAEADMAGLLISYHRGLIVELPLPLSAMF